MEEPLIRVQFLDDPMMAEARNDSRCFELDSNTIVKIVGYKTYNPWGRDDEYPKALYSTGTSQPNTLVMTDGMGPCIAVACSAEKIDPNTGNRLPGAKVRVFHFFQFFDEVQSAASLESLGSYIDKVREEGLTVRVAMHGGDDAAGSLATAESVRDALRQRHLVPDFDETGENRKTNTPLGAVIQEDNSVRFVTRIVARDV